MKYLSDYTEKAQTKLFDRLGVFFAFSNEQFDKNKTKLKKDEKYAPIGGGGYIPASNFKEYVAQSTELIKAAIKLDIAENGIDKIILRELYNYECFYVMDITEAVDALKPYKVSITAINKVFKNELATNKEL